MDFKLSEEQELIINMAKEFEEAAFRIRGKAGTTVKLTINRDGKVFDVQIERIAAF
jgi:C-terminal processing protease CtpA/Prc